MNVFRILGDVSHTISKCILIWAIHTNRSAEGVSLITQALYAMVFITRYLDLFWVSPGYNTWNFVLNNFYIISSLYIIFLMMRVYARTREREKAWKFGAFCMAGSALAAPFTMMIFTRKTVWSFSEVLGTFSIILESVCVLPQLLLLRQTTVPTVIDSFYLVTLGSYRAFFILDWILQAIDPLRFASGRLEFISPIFGVIQTAFYMDFAYVYWTRQRVKLRNGGVVDSEDLSRGWLFSKIMKRGASEPDEEDRVIANGPDNGYPRQNVGSRAQWGARGISVSADEGLLETPQPRKQRHNIERLDSIARQEETAGILEDNSDAEDSDIDVPPPDSKYNTAVHHVGNGEEWRKEESK
ncbi:MAG: hypothetical protein Q9187_006557 [Circinaria calcarea]